MTSHVGIYPGTFDPIHPGHLAFALKTLQACGLDEVVFLPERSPRRKYNVTDITARVTLIEKTIATIPNVRVATIAAKQFTVAQTLPDLRRMLPDSTLTLLVGSDVTRTLHLWEDVNVLLDKISSLAVGLRRGDTSRDMITAITALEQRYERSIRYTIIQTEHAHLASSQLRNTLVI